MAQMNKKGFALYTRSTGFKSLPITNAFLVFSRPLHFLNPSFTDGAQHAPRRGIFLNNSRWYTVTTLPIFLFVHWSPTDIKQSSFGTYIAFYKWYVFLNPTGPFCTHGRCSICPTAKDRKPNCKFIKK
jgi:hypothetical protein